MRMIRVRSTAIRAIGYDGYTLRVGFHHGGTCDHPGVVEQVFLEFLHAASHGRYYVDHIRGRHG